MEMEKFNVVELSSNEMISVVGGLSPITAAILYCIGAIGGEQNNEIQEDPTWYRVWTH